MSKETLHIVKVGGKLINDPIELDRLLEAFSYIDEKKILIHGGGRKATELSQQMGLEVKMIEGRRITDQDTLEVAVMVYAGLINKNIVAALQAKSQNAIGLCGADGNIIRAHKRPVKEVDYGWVGDVEGVDTENLTKLLSADFIPVFCAISHDQQGQLLNTNADTIASVIAQSLANQYSISLKYCFEYPGVLHDINNPKNTIDIITHDLYQSMKIEGSINEGMIPKIDNSIAAKKAAVEEVYICGIDNLISLNNATEISL